MSPAFVDVGGGLTILRVRAREIQVFANRHEAGRILGASVAKLPDLADGVVLGLVRGGVPVAFEVANACSLPLDILVVRKLGVPWQPELAMGAIASGGAIVLNEDVLRSSRITGAQLEQVTNRERVELHRREMLYRQGRPALSVSGRAVILVDDGLATGASMRVAIRAVKDAARRVVVAVPVGAKSTCEELKTLADEVVCALTPDPLEAVSQFYQDFEPTPDDEVRGLLSANTCAGDEHLL
ncbi:MAG: phosphoribosyltransferase [Acidobacteria bacterium]|nr:phosphoribosyltransferase [Acidobacteriota bacterium]